MRGTTYTERIPVVREYFWHEVKEVIVVFAKDDCLQSNSSQFRFEGWREFAFDPRF